MALHSLLCLVLHNLLTYFKSTDIRLNLLRSVLFYWAISRAIAGQAGSHKQGPLAVVGAKYFFFCLPTAQPKVSKHRRICTTEQWDLCTIDLYNDHRKRIGPIQHHPEAHTREIFHDTHNKHQKYVLRHSLTFCQCEDNGITTQKMVPGSIYHPINQ